MNFFSFGGGVQSHAVLVAQVQGLLHFDEYVFCNVGNDSERAKTLQYIEMYTKPFCEEHGITFVELYGYQKRDGSEETLLERIRRSQRSFVIPARIDSGAFLRRNCTVDFKVKRVERYIAKTYGKTSHQVGIGISVDEIERAKPNTDENSSKWKEHIFPLLDLGWNRNQCQQTVQAIGLPPVPKSSCKFCPFHTMKFWQEMRDHEPEEFHESVLVERLLLERAKALARSPVYLTRYRKPLDVVTTEMHQLDLPYSEFTCDSGYCHT